MWVVYPYDLCRDEGIVQCESLVLLVEGTLQQTRAYRLLILGFDGMFCRLPPVLVDAVLEEDDGKKADLLVLGGVKINGLQWEAFRISKRT